ncbi:acyltransferase family protein [Euzebyella saccharophila]|uniref:Acyltransferase family protein n=1 Tax=Euzebyella saccharophila TaxID=679664 RepID=A0ABV8JQ87_9FLAO|nr:acyltransferase family protein [Euzebyella saccharophila]
MKAARHYDIDALRVLTIALLLIYHIAIVFQPWALFVGFIKSDVSWESLWVPMSLLNVWRIPILFFVSGMGVYFAMRKRSWKTLIGERVQRILIPFLFGILAIAPLHIFIFQEFYGQSLNYYAHMGHLWFLGNIFVYVVCFLPIFYVLKRREGGIFKRRAVQLMSQPVGPLVIALFFMLEALLVKPQIYSLYAQTWHGFFLGALAFFFGYLLMYCGPTIWKTVGKWKWMYLLLGLVLFTLRYVYYQLEAPGYLMALESINWIFGVFGLCHQFLNKPSKLLSYASEAAYPVYIIHMVVLYLGCLWILPLPVPVYLQFVLLVVFTFVGCYAFYEFLIKRIWFLRPLFGLKFGRKRGLKSTKIISQDI